MTTIKSGAILLMLISLWGCSTANDTPITLDVSGKHPAGWAVASIGGNHPAAYQANKSACVECHGSAQDPLSTGGISGVSCFSTSRSGIACHPNGPSSHPAGWSAPGSHGSAAKAAAPGLHYCTQCHGTNFTGDAGKSCMTCHTTAPHPATPWRGTTATGTTHTTTATVNAAECARCHLNNLRLTVPQTVPAGSTPDCFNSTMCHGVRSGHPAGWLAASSHGSAAKAAPAASQGFAYCTQCHGNNFAGGIGLSCMTATCHIPAGPAPHPVAANWRSTGTVTHTNTDVNNAGVCTQCHNAALKNLAQPYLARFAPAGSFGAGTAGCFNGTLCHADIRATSNCTVCHGPLSATSFNSLAGVTAPSDAKVGAHIKHLNAAVQAPAYSANIACSECHAVPISPAVSGTHRNGVNDVVFGTLAKTGSLTPTYTAATGACANTYCHGTTLTGGGSNKSPVWNQANYLTAGCSTCHGYPPTTVRNGAAAHSASSACSGCHLHVNATNDGFTPTGIAQHINGSVEASGGAHAVPNYNHQAAGTGAACTACHAIGTATSAYPAATLGNAPDCRGCHKKAAPGIGCGSCHGAANGKPTGSAFPDRLGYHGGAQDGAHNNTTCTICHATGGSGSGVDHGPGNRNANPNAANMRNGITPLTGPKGASSTSQTCVHSTINGGCSGGGTKTGW